MFKSSEKASEGDETDPSGNKILPSRPIKSTKALLPAFLICSFDVVVLAKS